MAHVLLPCDLPNWSEIQRNLSPLKIVNDAEQLAQGMAKLHDLCCISLEPDDGPHSRKESVSSRFEGLQKFIEDMSEDDQSRFFAETLPNLVSQALCLRLAKPQYGFLYSLKKEEESFTLERNFVKSLLANAFFSTFPKRTPKTHPCLQNFSFSDFFQHLRRRSHQKKLKAFLRYFQKLDERKKSTIRFQRKVLPEKSQPSLPGWLCSDKPLVPLIVRQDGNIHNAEENICRAFPCTSLIGGDVLQAATAPESSLFFAFPELMCCLSFVEELEDNEAFLASHVVPHGTHKSRQSIAQEVNICLSSLACDSDEQFEDRFLLRELNKALVSFSPSKMDEEEDERMKQRRQTPVGESSSSSQPSNASSRRASSQRDDDESSKTPQLEGKRSSYLPMILKCNSASYAVDKSGITSLNELPKLPDQVKPSNVIRTSTSSSHSSSKSLRTASESSVELPKITRSTTGAVARNADDEYYTADEDSDQCCDKKSKRRTSKSSVHHKEGNLSTLVQSTSALVGEKPSKPDKGSNLCGGRESGNSILLWDSKDSSKVSSSQRSDSGGFVLEGTASDNEIGFADEEGDRGPPIHERLEDFRKRIRRRTRRHLSRKMRSSSRSSYSFGSSTSSDMEDISEEEDNDESFQLYHPLMRNSNSEPSLASVKENFANIPPFSLASDAIILSPSGRKMMITSSTGQLKAYSYDGVSPNLPVPFKAKFRTKKTKDSSEEHWDREDIKRNWDLSCEKFVHSDSEGDRTSTSRLSSLSSFAYPNQGSLNIEEEIVCRNKERPRAAMAVGPSRHGDPQLRALILWLAASMAGLPSLIFYTGHEFQLYELSTVYRKVLARHWTVGDLSCELLRFCRNRLSPRRNSCSSSLFEQLLCSGISNLKSTPLTYSQQSLD